MKGSEEWLTRMEGLGFEIVNAASLNIKQKAEKFRDCDIWVTELGSGLANVVFLPPKIKILVLMSPIGGSYRWGIHNEDSVPPYIKWWLPHADIRIYDRSHAKGVIHANANWEYKDIDDTYRWVQKQIST